MRGSSSPPVGLALLRLLAVLTPQELEAVLAPWRCDLSALLKGGDAVDTKKKSEETSDRDGRQARKVKHPPRLREENNR
jgi:hypothetical protein